MNVEYTVYYNQMERSKLFATNSIQQSRLKSRAYDLFLVNG